MLVQSKYKYSTNTLCCHLREKLLTVKNLLFLSHKQLLLPNYLKICRQNSRLFTEMSLFKHNGAKFHMGKIGLYNQSNVVFISPILNKN